MRGDNGCFRKCLLSSFLFALFARVKHEEEGREEEHKKALDLSWSGIPHQGAVSDALVQGR